MENQNNPNNAVPGSDIISASQVQTSNALNELKDRVKDLEILTRGLWLLLKDRYATNEEFDMAIAEAIRLESEKSGKRRTAKCKKCGHVLQEQNVFGVKCIYCGYEAISNPYAVEVGYTEEEIAAMQAEKNKPYDINDDLNFDDIQ